MHFNWKNVIETRLMVKTCKKNANGQRIHVSEKQLQGLSTPAPGLKLCIAKNSSISSETTWLIKAKFYVKLPYGVATKVYIII